MGTILMGAFAFQTLFAEAHEQFTWFERIENGLATFVGHLWNWPLLVLMVGGGIFFTIYSRGVPFRYFAHSISIIRGKYSLQDDQEGGITPFRALCTALAATVGMGNISGVALAITTGGPGALFWMWVSALIGMSTKFFTCSLAIMYRGKDEEGHIHGGPMYFIVEGLGPHFRPLAMFFSIAGLLGCLPLFQANQLTQIIRDEVFRVWGWFPQARVLGEFAGFTFTAQDLGNLVTGLTIMGIVSLVIFGGIERISKTASRIVPAMVVLYMGAALIIVFANVTEIPNLLMLIIRDAFTGQAVVGGAVGTVIVTGFRRAAFSNEAGIGTEAMAHGASNTREPIREGLVAMLGPAIDTLLVCSATGLVILSAGDWKGPDTGVTLTTQAFESALPGLGSYLLLVCVICFSISTMFGYSYYGCKCAGFLFGIPAKKRYNLFYIFTLGVASMVSLDIVINLLDGMFALMAIPTMTASILLAPRVMKAARAYFAEIGGAGLGGLNGPAVGAVGNAGERAGSDHTSHP
jgi:AGCS family alanine or glycine:cation symporter